MDRRRIVTVVSVAALLAATIVPATLSAQGNGPIVTYPSKVDVGPPLRDVKPLPTKMAHGFQVEIAHQPPPAHGRGVNPPGRGHELRQTQDRPDPLAALTASPSLDFEGLSDDDNAAVIGGRIVPPDTNGDIGPNHYVQYINLIYAVWDITRDQDGHPTGASLALGPIAGNAFWSGFGGVCEANNDGDPIVLYDHLADRWHVSQFSINQGIQCIAISTTPDPTGSYFRYEYVVSPGEQNDYPKLGMMPEAYYISLRDFPSNDGTFAGFGAWDRAAQLNGTGGPFVKFNIPCLAGDCPDGVQPPHLEGPAPSGSSNGIFTRTWDDDFEGPFGPAGGQDGVRMWLLDADFATPANSTFTELPYVPVTEFDSQMCGFFDRTCIQVPKQGGGSDLDSADELQMYRAQYRSFGSHDSFILSTTVDATGNDDAGVLWIELRNSGGGWSVHQEGVYAPADGLSRWMGSAALNGFGDIALGYSAADRQNFPSVRYVTREAGDPLGTMPGGEVVLVAGTGTQTQASRWGDYSSMSVDPVDDCTFWYTQEYYAEVNSFDFKTRVGAFKGAGCDVCVPDEAPEVSCEDGADNDCDGDVDCDDSDCSADPACLCELADVGESCAADGDCCSGSCSGGKPSTRVCLAN